MTRLHHAQADEFILTVERMGFAPVRRTANTGTVYVDVDGFNVRFADHGECYCREDVSVDPYGLELWQAIAAFCLHTKTQEPEIVAAGRKRFEAGQEREQQARAVRETRYQQHLAEVAMVDAWMAENGKTGLTGKRRKRARSKARGALGLTV